MVEKIKQLFVKYEEIIVYLIVGVINTMVCWSACFLVELFLDPSISWQSFYRDDGYRADVSTGEHNSYGLLDCQDIYLFRTGYGCKLLFE